MVHMLNITGEVMDMSYIWATGTTGMEPTDKGKTSNVGMTELPGRKDFLLLLITQLRHQDPLAPMEEKDFIAQLTQFSILEEIQGLNKNLTDAMEREWYQRDMNSAMSLLGWYVKANPASEGEPGIEGIVVKVGVKDGGWHVFLEDGRAVPLYRIIEARKAE